MKPSNKNQIFIIPNGFDTKTEQTLLNIILGAEIHVLFDVELKDTKNLEEANSYTDAVYIGLDPKGIFKNEKKLNTFIDLLEYLYLDELFAARVINYDPGIASGKGRVVYQRYNGDKDWFIDYGDFCAISLLSDEVIDLFRDKVSTDTKKICGWEYK